MRQQRCRDLHEANTAANDACCESCDVTDDAAAERNHQTAALEAGFQDALAQAGKRTEVLGGLSRCQNLCSGMPLQSLEGGLERGEMALRDILVGDDHAFGSAETAGDEPGSALQQPCSDQHVV